MTVVINLVGGPCCGKSTTAAGLFREMKLKTKKKVELITEVIKDHVYDENKMAMLDQILITAEQNHKLFRVDGKIDFSISDASLINGVVYNDFYSSTDELSNKMSLDLYHRYENITFLLPRKPEYDAYGRSQTLEEAKQIDELFLKNLKELNLPFHDMRMFSHEEMPSRIMEVLDFSYSIYEKN